MSDDAPPEAFPTPEQILSALDGTGFVLEYRVAQRLQDSHFDVILNDAFTDPDTGKSREIDVIATGRENVLAGQDIKILINAKLIIECKNYVDPLIIIGQDDTRYHNDEPLITFDPLFIEFADRNPENYGGIKAHLGMWKLPSHMTRGFIGRQLIKMQRHNGKWQATNDSVYDSIIYPLAKAVEHERKMEIDSVLELEAQPWHLPTFTYTFPALVTAGAIFTVDVVRDGEPVV